MSNNNSRQKKTNEKGKAALGFEATLWATADKLRGNFDEAELKPHVLGLIFVKYISDAFTEKHAELQKEKAADPEDDDEYRIRQGRRKERQCKLRMPKCECRIWKDCSIRRSSFDISSGGMFVHSVEFVKAHANGDKPTYEVQTTNQG